MATEAGDGPAGSLAERASAFLDLQIETLIAGKPETTALGAGRMAPAMKALWAARAFLADVEPADPTPAQTEGDEDDDDFEPPRDDEEGRELDAIILRGLDRIKARAEADPLGPGAAGQAGALPAAEDRASAGADTS